MSAPAEEIDWAQAERQERRRQSWAWPLLAAYFVGMWLLRGGSAFWSGGAGRLLLLVYLALVGVLVVASSLSPRLRERNAAAYRVQAAVRRHADPGPELRARADRLARYAASHGWLAWVALFGPAALILGGRWDHPVPAAAGTILLVAAAAGWVWWWLRRRADGRRWLADPPGPPREPPPVTRLERWTTGRRVVWLLLGVLVVATGAAVLAVLLR